MSSNVRMLDKPASYYENLREKINAGRAVTLINSAMKGQEITPQQERVSLFVLNKMLPSLQAVAVEHRHTQVETIEDLQAIANSAGVDLIQLWSTIRGQPLAPIEHNSPTLEHDSPEESDA